MSRRPATSAGINTAVTLPRSAARTPRTYAEVTRMEVPPPNGSRLSCGRPARRRKRSGRQSVPRQGHNTLLPLERSPPVSFKRLLGSTSPHLFLCPSDVLPEAGEFRFKVQRTVRLVAF